MLVVDASVAVKWIIDEPRSSEARDLLVAGQSETGVRETLLAPALLPIETHYAIAKRYGRGEATGDQLLGAIPALIGVFGSFQPLDLELATEAAALSFAEIKPVVPGIAQPFGVYDCVYIALAKRMRAALATADRRQAEIAKALRVPVRMV